MIAWRRRTNFSVALGLRSCQFSVEYYCTCGHQGWSNHVDIVRRAAKEKVLPASEAKTDYKLKRGGE